MHRPSTDPAPPRVSLDTATGVAATITAFDEMVRYLRAHQTAKMPSTIAWLDVQLTLAQLRALMLIADAVRGLPGRALAEQLGISPSAVTPLVDRLVLSGYACREEDVHDRRVTWIRPTERGVHLAERMAVAGREHLGFILGRLSPAELDQVHAAFRLLRDAAAHLLQESTALADLAGSGLPLVPPRRRREPAAKLPVGAA